jgi:hypothetical protein
MGVYDQSYAAWSGAYASRWGRIRAIVEMELAQPFKNVWILLVVILAFTIVAGWLIILFFAATQQVLPPFAAGNRIYRDGFYNFFFFSMILMVLSTTVGASLIARDLRHNALVMYFSRAITRADYLAGKFLALSLFLLIATLGPGLLLWSGQAGMGQEKLTFGQRLGDLGAITLHSLILVVPISSMVLAFSALTRRAYVAGILWATFYFASWIFSEVLQKTLKEDWPRMISWMNLTAHLGDLCYPARGDGGKAVLDCGWIEPLAILGSITVLSLAVVWRRLRSVEERE